MTRTSVRAAGKRPPDRVSNPINLETRDENLLKMSHWFGGPARPWCQISAADCRQCLVLTRHHVIFARWRMGAPLACVSVDRWGSRFARFALGEARIRVTGLTNRCLQLHATPQQLTNNILCATLHQLPCAKSCYTNLPSGLRKKGPRKYSFSLSSSCIQDHRRRL